MNAYCRVIRSRTLQVNYQLPTTKNQLPRTNILSEREELGLFGIPVRSAGTVGTQGRGSRFAGVENRASVARPDDASSAGVIRGPVEDHFSSEVDWAPVANRCLGRSKRLRSDFPSDALTPIKVAAPLHPARVPVRRTHILNQKKSGGRVVASSCRRVVPQASSFPS